jgi:hypothetical protein
VEAAIRGAIPHIVRASTFAGRGQANSQATPTREDRTAKATT